MAKKEVKHLVSGQPSALRGRQLKNKASVLKNQELEKTPGDGR